MTVKLNKCALNLKSFLPNCLILSYLVDGNRLTKFILSVEISNRFVCVSAIQIWNMIVREHFKIFEMKFYHNNQNVIPAVVKQSK